MDELGEITRSHPALFVNGYVLCDWVKEHLGGLGLDKEEIDSFVSDMIDYIEDDD